MKIIIIIITIITITALVMACLAFSKAFKNDRERYSEKIKPIITFIIPSIGRSTITRTIKSLQNLNNPNWKAIVVFDGVKSNIKDIKDNRITVYEIEKKGKDNLGGLARNYGIDKVKNTEWIGFVDDDDTLSPDYIDKVLEEIKKDSKVDCIIFREYWGPKSRGYLPPLDTNKIVREQVGISFCAKTAILKKNKFLFEPHEDYALLARLSKKNYNILLSENITYFVRMEPIEDIYKNKKGNVLSNPEFIASVTLSSARSGGTESAADAVHVRVVVALGLLCLLGLLAIVAIVDS